MTTDMEREKRINLYEMRNKYLVDTPDKFPEDTFGVILVFQEQNIYHEGDERSRTHPGHGYPSYTENRKFADIYAFRNQEDYVNALVLFYDEKPLRKDIVAYTIKRKTKATVKIDLE